MKHFVLIAAAVFSVEGAYLSMTGCAAAPGYRTPPDPAQLWIWPDRAEAERWRREHPSPRLCVRRVPDGYATARC